MAAASGPLIWAAGTKSASVGLISTMPRQWRGGSAQEMSPGRSGGRGSVAVRLSRGSPDQGTRQKSVGCDADRGSGAGEDLDQSAIGGGDRIVFASANRLARIIGQFVSAAAHRLGGKGNSLGK